jgi:hypothetical protein
LDRPERSRDVRPTAAEGDRDPVSVGDVPRAREDDTALAVGVPADVVDVEVGQEDDVDVVRHHTCLGQRRQQPFLSLRRPTPEPGRPDAGVDEYGRPGRAEQVRRAGKAPLRAGKELWVEVAVDVPIRILRIQLVELAQQADRVDEGHDLDGPDYHLIRSGGGSPCASCQPITGLRSTPIRSISASIRSPGFR